MFVQTVETPNPNSLKFIPENLHISDRVIECKNKDDAKKKSYLAVDILSIDGVDSLMFGNNFITVSKDSGAQWSKLKIKIIAEITDYLKSKKPILMDFVENTDASDSDSEIIKQIKELIEIKIRPAVAMDGGDIVFESFEDGVVYLRLKGSCSGCPSSMVTLKSGIENMLKHYIPEVESVEQVPDD